MVINGTLAEQIISIIDPINISFGLCIIQLLFIYFRGATGTHSLKRGVCVFCLRNLKQIIYKIWKYNVVVNRQKYDRCSCFDSKYQNANNKVEQSWVNAT